MCWITGRFFADCSEENITLPDRTRKKMEKSHRAVLITTVIVASVMASTAYFRAVYKGNILINAGIFRRTQITAHRGASLEAPENTRYAFEAAMKGETDYIELDVQLTKDGKLVVFHDNTLGRTTNGSGLLTEHTYDELTELSAGCKFGSGTEFADAKIMTLEEVLELVGKSKMLNIEIKDIGDSVRATEKTVELIEKYNIVSSCYVSSFSYPLLKLVKELNPKIKTALIANVATSTAFSRLDDIDAVSLNYIFVNQSVVNAAHQSGKRVFVWTVDNREDIEQMMTLGVDNIITNRPDTAAEAVYSKSVGKTILKILELICG
jgi:glycerophosphoryl diester phosphodiesterase